MYYSQYSLLINVSYLSIAILFMLDLYENRTLIFRNYIYLSFVFLLCCIFSIIISHDVSYAMSQVILLLKISLPSYLLLNTLRNKELTSFTVYMLALSALLYSILYLQYVDFDNLGADRIAINDENGIENINVVAFITSISSIIFLTTFIEKKRKLDLCFFIVSILIVFLLGSRKSIFSVLIFFIVLFFNTSKENKKKLLLLLSVSIIAILIALPADYFTFIANRSNVDFHTLDSSDMNRIRMIRSGLIYFQDNPIFGNGYYNFAVLYNQDFGSFVYAHNNFVELLADLGLIGFFLYYSLYLLIIKDLRKSNQSYIYVLSVILVILFSSNFIVLLHNRYAWLILATSYALIQHSKQQI